MSSIVMFDCSLISSTVETNSTKTGQSILHIYLYVMKGMLEDVIEKIGALSDAV